MLSKTEVLMKYFNTEDTKRSTELQRRTFRMPYPPIDELSTLKLPYIAPGFTDLPTVADFDKAMIENRLHLRNGLREVCRIGDYVVKRADEQIVQEAEDMLYLQEHSQVRVPKVYAVYTIPLEYEGIIYTKYCLVMEYMHGFTLQHPNGITRDEKNEKMIAASLAEQLRLLRSTPPPPKPYYGRVNYQAFPHNSPLVGLVGDRMYGPYDTYDEFISASYDSVQFHSAICTNAGALSKSDVKYLEQMTLILGGSTANKPMLTHVDPKLDNIVARPIRGAQDEIVDWEVTLIDWAWMAWLPQWYQHFALKMRFAFRDEDEKSQNLVEQVWAGVEDHTLYSKEVAFLRDYRLTYAYGVV